MADSDAIVIAVPKGRALEPLARRFTAAGLDGAALLADDRRLVREESVHGVRFLLLKPGDVPTYVEYGVADLGIVGRDVLLEREYDVYVPFDLRIGVCRMVVAGLSDSPPATQGVLRVATKYPTIAMRHFLARGRQVDVIYVQGSVELAPVVGLADVIVDLVETGETLRRNGLVELERVCDISTVIVANRVGLKLKRRLIAPLLEKLGAASGRSNSSRSAVETSARPRRSRASGGRRARSG